MGGYPLKGGFSFVTFNFDSIFNLVGIRTDIALIKKGE